MDSMKIRGIRITAEIINENEIRLIIKNEEGSEEDFERLINSILYGIEEFKKVEQIDFLF